MKESCHTYEWVMLHISKSHVTHMNESCHIYDWVMSHIRMSHVTHTNESWHTYEWVMSHIWMSHVTHMNESCHTYEWVICHMPSRRQMSWSFICVTWLIRMCDMTHSFVWHDSFTSHAFKTINVVIPLTEDIKFSIINEARTDMNESRTHMDESRSYMNVTNSHNSTHPDPLTEDTRLNIWISRSTRFSSRSFEWRGLRLITWKHLWIYGDSTENVLDMYGDSRKNVLGDFCSRDLLSLICSVQGIWMRMRHVTHMNEACHTYKWVMSHIWMSHVTRIIE